MDEFSNKIESCYGLPYGIFGLICWSLSFFSNFLLYCKIPLFSPWKWGKPYESQSYFFAFIAFTMTIGPTIYTCIRCREEWILIVLAIGQLSPWAFKMFHDGFLANDQELSRDGFYNVCGISLSILLGLIGWVGLTALIIRLANTTYAVNPWMLCCD